MPSTQWVISKYAKEGDEVEKFEVMEARPASYLIKVFQHNRYYYLDVPKTEYIPITPPERWETVPITDNVLVSQDGRKLLKRYSVESWCSENEQFTIQDGKLVLQRRIT